MNIMKITFAVLCMVLMGLTLHAEKINLFDLFTGSDKPRRTQSGPKVVFEKRVTVEKPIVVEKSVTNIVNRVVEKKVVVEKPVVVEKSVTNFVDRIIEKEVLVDRPVTNLIERLVEKPVVVEKEVTNIVEKIVTNDVIVEKPVTNFIDRVVEKEVVVEKPVLVEKEVTNIVEKIVTNDVIVEKPVTNFIDRVVEKEVVVERPITNIVEKHHYHTNVVEKIIIDEDLERRAGKLEMANADLEESNDALKRRLAELESQNSRLQRVAPKSEVRQLSSRPAKITSASTYYDRKEGFAVFTGKVHVDDVQYQLHANKAYVFFDGTNQLHRIVAIGGVAITNDTKRAYGGKASYYKKTGMVVLYAGQNGIAEVRDESKVEDQIVKGSKIKFWVNSEQVEVLDARISAPTSGAAGLKGVLGK